MKVPHWLEGHTVVLVPYAPGHVAKYHRWMLDPTIQYLTRSEPLTLAEEYAMQIDWEKDPHKLTFIILARELWERTGGHEATDDDAMIGDVNLFFAHDDEDRPHPEVDVMVAEPQWRRHGAAREALCLIMRYAMEHLCAESFTAKIREENTPSIRLMESLGYTLHQRVPAFEEVHCRWADTPDARATLFARTAPGYCHDIVAPGTPPP